MMAMKRTYLSYYAPASCFYARADLSLHANKAAIVYNAKLSLSSLMQVSNPNHIKSLARGPKTIQVPYKLQLRRLGLNTV